MDRKQKRTFSLNLAEKGISKTVVELGSLKTEVEIEVALNTKQAAEYLGISARTLLNLTSNGTVKYYKLGRRNRYRLDDLRNLLFAESRGGK